MEIEEKYERPKAKSLIKKVPINSIVLFTCILSFIWILVYKMYFLQIDPIFPRAYEIAEITYTLLSAVVASGIFYFFVVVLDQKRTSRIINPILIKRLKVYEHSNYFIKKGIYDFKALEVPHELPSMEEFHSICEGIDLNEIGPVIHANPLIQSKDWYDFFQYHLDSDFHNSRLLLNYIKYLPITIIEHVDGLQYSAFQTALDTYKRRDTLNKLSGISNPLWTYLKASENLSKIGKQLKK